MNIFFQDKYSTNFQPQIPHSFKTYSDSWNLFDQNKTIEQLVLGSDNPKFFFDATLWFLEHQQFGHYPLKALTPHLEEWQKNYIRSCPFFHLYEEFLPIGFQEKTLENSLFNLWGQLSQPWHQVSAQFAQLYQKEKQPWLLGLNSWLYKDNKDEYFSQLYENLTTQFHHCPWAQYFMFYYYPVDQKPLDLLKLSESSLGPYAQLSLMNHYLKYSQSSKVIQEYLNFIFNLYSQPLTFSPHRLDLMSATLRQLFSQSENQIFVYQFFEKIFRPLELYQNRDSEDLTYILGQAFLNQNFQNLESSVENFYPQGLHLTELQAQMMDYMHKHFQLFGTVAPLIEYYQNKRA